MDQAVRPLTEGMTVKGGHNAFPSQVTERPGAPAVIHPRESHFVSDWRLSQRVHIDGDTSIIATVTGFCFRLSRQPTVEVSYFHNGDSKSAWVEETRLSSATA